MLKITYRLFFLFTLLNTSPLVFADYNDFQDKPILSELINPRLHIQLIDDELEHITVSVFISSFSESVNAINSITKAERALTRELALLGFRFNSETNSFGVVLSTLSSKESSNELFSTLVSSLRLLLNSEQSLKFDIIIAGTFNQQRLLGSFHKELSGSEFNQAPSLNTSSSNAIELDKVQIAYKTEFWKERFLSSLLKCQQSNVEIPSFIYDGEELRCNSGSPIPNDQIYMQTVNLKNSIQSLYRTNSRNLFSSLNSAFRFSADRRFELYRGFHNNFAEISIDRVVRDYQESLGLVGTEELVNQTAEIVATIPDELSNVIYHLDSMHDYWLIDITSSRQNLCELQHCESLNQFLESTIPSISGAFTHRFKISDTELNNWLELFNSWNSETIGQGKYSISKILIVGGTMGSRYDELFETLQPIAKSQTLQLLLADTVTVVSNINLYAIPGSVYSSHSNLMSYILEYWCISEAEINPSRVTISNTILSNQFNSQLLLSQSANQFSISEQSEVEWINTKLGIVNFFEHFSEDDFMRYKKNASRSLEYSAFENNHLEQINSLFQLEETKSSYVQAIEQLNYTSFMDYYNVVIKPQLLSKADK